MDKYDNICALKTFSKLYMKIFLQWNFKYITFSYCNTTVCTYVYFALKSYMWILITCLIENYLNLWNIIHFIMWFAWKIHGHFVWKKKNMDRKNVQANK